MTTHRENITLGSLLKEATEKKEGKIIENVQFQQDWTTPGLRFISGGLGRKLIILDTNEKKPDLNQSYDVKIIKDTKPFESKRGAYIVRIIKTGKAAKQELPAQKNIDNDVPMADAQERVYVPKPIERDEIAGKVYVLETEVSLNPVGGEKVPKPERFKHFTLDEPTLEILDKIATAVELRNPCLLEGETSTSKTSSIEYLAMMSNNEVARMNLNGQTDTSELIGKFVPNDGQLQIAFQELLRSRDSLSQDSRLTIERAERKGIALTLIESQKIAQAENLKIADWRWQNGIDVEAKLKGQWLILDEINLAEPQILERLNPQLEKSPSITLSESGDTVIRDLNPEEMELYQQGKLPGVKPLHPNFHIFGTMNPTDYAGRQPMSPAYKDRWTSYKYVKNPTAKEYMAMMALMIYGEQPAVTIRGQKYEPSRTEGVFSTLEKLSNFRSFLPKVAKFQEAIENLARNREIGRGKKEPYSFTRRGFIEFLTYLEDKTIIDRKTRTRITIESAPEEIITRGLQYYYLDKIANPEDLQKVQDQLDLIGISEKNWTHKFK